MHQKFPVAVGAGNRRVDEGHALQSYFSGRGLDLRDHARVNRFALDQSATSDVLRVPASNCGFTSATISAAGLHEQRQDGKDEFERDERHVDADAGQRSADVRQIAPR